MDTVEKRELPGNDASWYRALLGDQEGNGRPRTDRDAADAAASVGADTAALTDTSIDSSSEDTETADETVAASADEVAADPQTTALGGDVQKPVEFPSDTGEPDTADSEDLAGADAPHANQVDTAQPAPDTTAEKMITAVPPLAAADDAIDNTSEMVGQLWTASAPSGPLDDWAPDDMDRKVSSSRSIRWTSIVGVLAIVGLIAVGLVLLPTIARNRADSHREMLTTALTDLRGELPETQTSLAVATDPASTPAELTALSTQLTALAAKASALDEAAMTELPSVPPFTGRAPIEELEPIRQELEPLGSIATSIQRRIANLAAYRTLMAGFLNLPDLPITADSSSQAELRVTLAAAQADSASILAELPDDVALAEHRSLARDLNERFSGWQVEYLEALRTEDSVIARGLLAELGDGLAALDNALITPLAEIRADTDMDLIALAGSIDAVVTEANGGSTSP